jgi:hypothetical protein
MKAKWFLHEALRKNLKGAKMSHKSLRQFASLFLALAIIFGGFTPVRADTNIQLIPMDDGCVFDQSPFDGFGDAVEYSLSVCSGLNPGIAEFRGAMEFDVSSITSSNTIESAALYVTPTGRWWLPGTSNMPLQLFGYTGNGAIGNDDFNAGSVIAIFDGLTIPFNVPVILDVTEFLQNQAPTNYVGFSLRTDVHGGVDFGSLELGPAPILLITLRPTTDPILDDFNRLDGPLGSNWLGSKTAYRILGNQVDVRGNGPIYWKDAFGVDQEVAVTLTTVDPAGKEQDLLLKVQGQYGPNWGEGAIEVLYNAKTGTVAVWTFRPDTLKWFKYPPIPVTFVNGDKFGAQALATGEVVIFKNGTEVGRMTLNPADQAFFNPRGGYIGLWFIDARNAFFDNFGGGDITMP